MVPSAMDSMNKNLDFSSWIRGRRAEKRQTQNEAAAEVGVSRGLWVIWEGKSDLPVSKVTHVHKIALWAGCEAGDLLPMLTAGLESTGNESAA